MTILNSVFQRLCPIEEVKGVQEVLDGVKDFSHPEMREVKVKRARGISLKACVAKATGWTLEKANASPVQEVDINKTS